MKWNRLTINCVLLNRSYWLLYLNKRPITRAWTRCLSTGSTYRSKDTHHHPIRTTQVNLKKFPVIDVWLGITPQSMSKITGKSVDDVEEGMILSDVDDLETFDRIVKVCNVLGFRCRQIKHPLDEVDQVNEPKMVMTPKIGTTMVKRPPIVTIMGHVDHGKTSILDFLRKSEIAKGEFGGITQHIGAFVVSLDSSSPSKASTSAMMTGGKKEVMTFLDTPGHAAFHQMRQRGAQVTDIIVLVVAADDGMMDQTIESMQYAREGNVPIVVAINKVDKVKDVDEAVIRIKHQLNSHGIALEGHGGDTQYVLVSALEGTGMHLLKESIIALAETLDLKAPSDGHCVGTVIESSLDQARGRLATILIKSGTLKRGDIMVSNEVSSMAWVKVRSMFDEHGRVHESVGSGFPCQVIGWKDNLIPDVGHEMVQVDMEKAVKEVMAMRKNHLSSNKYLVDMVEGKKRYKDLDVEYKKHLETKRSSSHTPSKYWKMRPSAELMSTFNPKESNEPKINLILKGDVNGSIEVLLDIMSTYPNDSQVVKVNVISYGVGPVTQSDLELASLFSDTIIYGFNVSVQPKINILSRQQKVTIRSFNVIYHLIDDIKKQINERSPEVTEYVELGEAMILQQFMVTDKGNKKVPVAGCRITRGQIKKSPLNVFKWMRRDDVILDRIPILSMRHMKAEVESLKKDTECGLRLDISHYTPPDDPNIPPADLNFLGGDRLICYSIQKVKPITTWSPGF